MMFSDEVHDKGGHTLTTPELKEKHRQACKAKARERYAEKRKHIPTVVEMKRAGKSWSTIAAATGISEYTAKAYWREYGEEA